ncbi:MAG TPA: hypothetical protein PK781_04200 [Terrimesophilobacter sp.]|nr:hypothetical protein [Terrimesophilobacter sp.]HRP99644.1 hypothetical protein [Terrimesophilobacter sp.]
MRALGVALLVVAVIVLVMIIRLRRLRHLRLTSDNERRADGET